MTSTFIRLSTAPPLLSQGAIRRCRLLLHFHVCRFLASLHGSFYRGQIAKHALNLTAEPEPLPLVHDTSVENQRPSIKIRLATFNMHDTLPTTNGDFADWLGNVSMCPSQGKKRKRSSMSSRNSTMTLPIDETLPKFPLTSDHPYHIIVVASQECPTASGVLAGRVRTLDGRGWTNMLENYLCGGSCYDSESESESESSETGERREGRGSVELARGDGGEDSDTSDEASITPGTRPTTSQANREDEVSASQAPSLHGSSSGDSRRRRGPYVLIQKERLMGIYIAVFVARSCEDLVDGVSKSRVPAGLIGGRLGNKGGESTLCMYSCSSLIRFDRRCRRFTSFRWVSITLRFRSFGRSR